MTMNMNRSNVKSTTKINVNANANCSGIYSKVDNKKIIPINNILNRAKSNIEKPKKNFVSFDDFKDI